MEETTKLGSQEASKPARKPRKPESHPARKPRKETRKPGGQEATEPRSQPEKKRMSQEVRKHKENCLVWRCRARHAVFTASAALPAPKHSKLQNLGVVVLDAPLGFIDFGLFFDVRISFYCCLLQELHFLVSDLPC